MSFNLILVEDELWQTRWAWIPFLSRETYGKSVTDMSLLIPWWMENCGISGRGVTCSKGRISSWSVEAPCVLRPAKAWVWEDMGYITAYTSRGRLWLASALPSSQTRGEEDCYYVRSKINRRSSYVTFPLQLQVACSVKYTIFFLTSKTTSPLLTEQAN